MSTLNLDVTSTNALLDRPSGELLSDIARAVKTQSKPIEIADLEKEIDAILKPLEGLPMLLDMAKDEMRHVHTVSLSFCGL